MESIVSFESLLSLYLLLFATCTIDFIRYHYRNIKTPVGINADAVSLNKNALDSNESVLIVASHVFNKVALKITNT